MNQKIVSDIAFSEKFFINLHFPERYAFPICNHVNFFNKYLTDNGQKRKLHAATI